MASAFYFGIGFGKSGVGGNGLSFLFAFEELGKALRLLFLQSSHVKVIS
jgi:hypothetical protein